MDYTEAGNSENRQEIATVSWADLSTAHADHSKMLVVADQYQSSLSEGHKLRIARAEPALRSVERPFLATHHLAPVGNFLLFCRKSRYRAWRYATSRTRAVDRGNIYPSKPWNLSQ